MSTCSRINVIIQFPPEREGSPNSCQCAIQAYLPVFRVEIKLRLQRAIGYMKWDSIISWGPGVPLCYVSPLFASRHPPIHLRMASLHLGETFRRLRNALEMFSVKVDNGWRGHWKSENNVFLFLSSIHIYPSTGNCCCCCCCVTPKKSGSRIFWSSWCIFARRMGNETLCFGKNSGGKKNIGTWTQPGTIAALTMLYHKCPWFCFCHSHLVW